MKMNKIYSKTENAFFSNLLFTASMGRYTVIYIFFHFVSIDLNQSDSDQEYIYIPYVSSSIVKIVNHDVSVILLINMKTSAFGF